MKNPFESLRDIQCADRLERIEFQLTRIADALERAVPPIPLRPRADAPDAEIIEPETRNEWDEEQEQPEENSMGARLPGEVLE